jgi:glycogen debranching enzyme
MRWICAFILASSLYAQAPRSAEYRALQNRLARGWNTWDVNSVTAQALLPEGFTIRTGLKHNSSLNSDAFLADALIGRQGQGVEQVFPGPHTWNGSYTQLRLSWHGHTFVLESAHDGEDLVMLATPEGAVPAVPPTLVFSAGVLWNRPGAVFREDDFIEFRSPTRQVRVYTTAKAEPVQPAPVSGPYFAAALVNPIGLATGKPRTLDQIRQVIERERVRGTSVAQAIETVLGWDTIYEPSKSRVVSPVSRVWSTNWGGYVLFDWDTFFAASMAAIGSRDLAYADALETLGEETSEGFVPNYARAGGWKSFDRSEPPVGAITILGLYRQFKDRWLLRDAFDPLLRWNRWWAEHRSIGSYLVWGTDPENKPGNPDDRSVGEMQAAKYESGLDNSPMYDDAPFDKNSHRMRLADVGLMGLYVADCDALAEIARELGKNEEAKELTARGETYRAALRTLWDERTGIFLNRNLDTGALSPRLSPTNFYPLLAKAATPAQASRMVKEHLLNPAEFWGDWVLPSIARSDPAFRDQEYWRGRIWGPMNYLVYLGLLNYNEGDARKQLAERSLALFEKEWARNGHVHENYNAVTGEGDDVRSSDRFYHWGALLGLIQYLENGSR